MKTKNKNTSKLSKGDRLGWTSLKDVKAVKLIDTLTEGEVLEVVSVHPLLVP